MANAINSLSYNSNTYVFTTPYGSCSTAAGTAAKTVTVDNFSLETGARVAVKFTVTNTAGSPTLNVNSTGAKAIYYNGAAITAGYLKANKVYEFIYNGTQWDFVGDIDTDTNTKNTAGSTNSSSKLFLIGATSQAANPQTYSHDTAYVGTDGHLYSNSKQVVNLSDTQALTNKTYNGYTLAAACAKGVDTAATDGSANLITSGAVYTSVAGLNNTIYVNEINTELALNQLETALALKAASSHNHAASEITSGTLAAARLPLATTSAVGGVKVGSNISVSSGTISLTKANVTAALGYTPPTSDTNTTYSAGTGISLSGTTFSNSGVRSISTGSSNGTISVNTNGTSANVAVKGLGSAAYTASTAYAAASHTHAILNQTNSGQVGLLYEASDTTLNYFKPYNPVSGHKYYLGSQNYPWDGLYIKNDNHIYSIDSSGNPRTIMCLNKSNNLAIGYDNYANKDGKTNLYGGIEVNQLVPYGSSYTGTILKAVGNDTYSAYFYPITDGKIALGTSAARWIKVYASSSAIATSDEREKSDIMSIADYPVTYSRDGSGNVFEKLFNKLQPKTYTLDIEDSNELHIGLIAQDIVASMEELGLSESDLALVDHSYWTDEETGEERDRYGLAYGEFTALNIYMIQKQQARIETLEERIAQLEALVINN